MHIEIVTKLDTASCLNPFMHIIGRRVKLIKKVSDNRTNFVGADRQFKENVEEWNKDSIEDNLV